MSISTKAWRSQLGALRNIPELFAQIWQVNSRLMLSNIVLRLIRSTIPLASLWIAKEILDEVVRLINVPHTPPPQYLYFFRPTSSTCGNL